MPQQWESDVGGAPLPTTSALTWGCGRGARKPYRAVPEEGENARGTSEAERGPLGGERVA